MADMEKLIKIFDEIGIKYSVEEHKIIIKSDYYCSYEFDPSGNFIKFFATE